MIEALPSSVRMIATYMAGLDHIDVAAASARGIIVVNTPEVLSEAVAEVAMLLMLGAARRATEGIALLRGGQWTGWTPGQLIGFGLSGKTLGLLGMGQVGRRVALEPLRTLERRRRGGSVRAGCTLARQRKRCPSAGMALDA